MLLQTQITPEKLEELNDGQEIEMSAVDTEGNDHPVYVEPVESDQ